MTKIFSAELKIKLVLVILGALGIYMTPPNQLHTNFIIMLSLILSGTLMNWTAIALNKGKMPVYTNDNMPMGKFHKPIKERHEARVFLLADIFTLSVPHRVEGEEAYTKLAFSVGDVLIIFGILSIIL